MASIARPADPDRPRRRLRDPAPGALRRGGRGRCDRGGGGQAGGGARRPDHRAPPASRPRRASWPFSFRQPRWSAASAGFSSPASRSAFGLALTRRVRRLGPASRGRRRGCPSACWVLRREVGGVRQGDRAKYRTPRASGAPPRSGLSASSRSRSIIPGGFLAIGAVLAVARLGRSAPRSGLSSDIRALAPQSLPAPSQDLNRVQDATGVSGELDVSVEAPDLTDPATIRWMAALQAAGARARTGSQGPSRAA